MKKILSHKKVLMIVGVLVSIAGIAIVLATRETRFILDETAFCSYGIYNQNYLVECTDKNGRFITGTIIHKSIVDGKIISITPVVDGRKHGKQEQLWVGDKGISIIDWEDGRFIRERRNPLHRHPPRGLK